MQARPVQASVRQESSSSQLISSSPVFCPARLTGQLSLDTCPAPPLPPSLPPSLTAWAENKQPPAPPWLARSLSTPSESPGAQEEPPGAQSDRSSWAEPAVFLAPAPAPFLLSRTRENGGSVSGRFWPTQFHANRRDQREWRHHLIMFPLIRQRFNWISQWRKVKWYEFRTKLDNNHQENDSVTLKVILF